MKLWQSLYAMVWLNLAAMLVGTIDVIPHRPQVHATLGLLVVLFAFRNKMALGKSQAPRRIKRIAGASATIGVLALGTGVLLAIPALEAWKGVVGAFHVVTIVALIAQSGSIATAYDMWEEKECA